MASKEKEGIPGGGRSPTNNQEAGEPRASLRTREKWHFLEQQGQCS